MEHFYPERLFFFKNVSSCTVIQDYTVIRDIRVSQYSSVPNKRADPNKGAGWNFDKN